MSKKLPVGIQVYGLRDLLENTPENFKNVMQQVKDLGYDGVELAGLYGLTPEYVKEVLDEIGLIPISAHVAFAEMMEDLDTIIADYKKIMLNKVGKKIHDAGMTFLYHNHDFEFVKMADGQWGYDVMFDSIPHDNLMPELDTCWCDVATGDAPGFIRKYTDRIPVVHLKDYIKKGEVKNMYKLIGIEEEESEGDTGYFGFRPVGFGQMIWEPVLEASLDANAQWVIVEQDEHYELEPMECARRSREYLKILG